MSVQLLIAMVAVSMIALIATPVVLGVAERQAVNQLPLGLRERVDDLSRPSLPLGMQRPMRDRMMSPGEFRGESDRLLTLVQDLRQYRVTAGFVTFGIVLVASSLLAWLLSSRFARPVEAVSSAAGRVAAGDFSARTGFVETRGMPSEVRTLASDFDAMAASLERLESERRALIADVAHELRNPLATLTLRLDAAAQGLVTLDQDEVAKLQSQTSLLTRLVNDLGTLSKVEGRRLDLHRSPLDVRQVVHEAISMHRAIADAKQVRLEVVEPNEEVVVNGDRDRLLQVLGNLLDNALRVAPEGSAVVASLKVSGHEVHVGVADEGPGFEVDPPERIFDRFVHGERSDLVEGGSGLGLAIARGLVAMHDGRVFAAREGNRTIVGFVLPLA